MWDVRREVVDLGAAGEVTREFVDHPGAVAILALDEHGRAAVVQQYRHPVGAREWELPAGLLDTTGETAAETAARELREEADLTAARWDVLVDIVSSPGGISEAQRIFLARGLGEIPPHERYQRHGEELGMPRRWVSLETLVGGVLAGDLHNATLALGALAAQAARASGWSTLRPVDDPWPRHAVGPARD